MEIKKEDINTFYRQLYKTSLTMPYGYFKIYINAMSRSIEDDTNNYEKKLDEQRAKEGFLSTFVKGAIHEINKVSIPKYFLNASFIFVYSKFEGDLKSICMTYQKQKNFDLSVADLGKYNYISNCRKYLQKCFKLDMNSLNTEWESITKYQQVRNAIVHNSSNILKGAAATKDMDLYNIINGNSYFSFEQANGDFHIKDKQYILDFCDLASTYIEKTIEIMDKS